MSNKRADKFKQKQLPKANEILANHDNSIEALRKLIYGLSMTVFNMDRKVKQMEASLSATLQKARTSDFRSLAMLQLLDENGSLSKELTVSRVFDLHVKEFDEASALHDQEQNLENITDDAGAANGNHVILTAMLFKDGQEVLDERIIRSKIELGKEELFKGVDAALVGMKVNEAKRITVETEAGLREMEFTVLALRKVKPQPVEEQPLQEAANSAESN
jgi:hypothetical protein